MSRGNLKNSRSQPFDALRVVGAQANGSSMILHEIAEGNHPTRIGLHPPFHFNGQNTEIPLQNQVDLRLIMRPLIKRVARDHPILETLHQLLDHKSFSYSTNVRMRPKFFHRADPQKMAEEARVAPMTARHVRDSLDHVLRVARQIPP